MLKAHGKLHDWQRNSAQGLEKLVWRTRFTYIITYYAETVALMLVNAKHTCI